MEISSCSKMQRAKIGRHLYGATALMPTGVSVNLRKSVHSYGVPNRSLRQLDDTSSSSLDYLDLLANPGADADEDTIFPDAVAESQGRPLLFIIDESRLAQSPSEQERQLKKLRRKLACRGDRAYLARVRPGELAVVPVSLDEQTPEWQIYRPGTHEASTFFSRLAQGQYDGEGEPKEADYVFSSMFKLVLSVADRLAALSIKRVDVLSLMGRALFFRFLCDRNVVRECDRNKIAPKARNLFESFQNAENAASTSAWLDSTFNGDLLPLSDAGSTDYFKQIGHRTGDRVFAHLSAIIEGIEPVGDDNYQLPLGIPDFGQYDFAHIPVGLLSQVYERFAWKWENQNAKETSVHYTPRNIAATLVDEAFEKLPNAHAARVLDPACGASVFLVLAFRRLYQEQWRASLIRPDTKAIREILENQLIGFDISDSAIKLAALSLYLTAIELDPKPVPPEKLRFKRLRDKVLFNFRREGHDPDVGAVLGSLGDHVGRTFDGRFDLILSNPPWTSLKGKDRILAQKFSQLSKEIIERRIDKVTAASYENPDFSPDLPFVWKATEWCKPGGRIAMALPARILLKQHDVPRRAREVFFRAIEVTGIINGTNLSDTPVWPKMGQLFARNRIPKPNHELRLITPQYDNFLNRKGEMKIDSKSSQTISVESTFDQPWIWKALALGTSLDVEVVKNLHAGNFPKLSEYWNDILALPNATGYMVKEIQTQRDASFLIGLPNFTDASPQEFVVNTHWLSPFHRPTLCWPRERDNYRAPLFLLKQSPGNNRQDGWAVVADQDIAFNQNFYGYSAFGHPDGDQIVRYLLIFCHSILWVHHALITAPIFGAERRVFYKTDFDDCPIVPFESLTETQRISAGQLANRLIAGDLTVFSEIDSFFGEVFGLSKRDMEVVRDTVDVSMPYTESRNRASLPPQAADREKFRKRLESILRPFFKVVGEDSYVELWKPQGASTHPFGFLLISKKGTPTPFPEQLLQPLLLQLAEDTGCSRIIQEMEGGLLIALIHQYRYWTPSRARLLGAQLVREHLDVFDI